MNNCTIKDDIMITHLKQRESVKMAGVQFSRVNT